MRLRNIIFRDGWLKLFSLALAVLIWVTVSYAIRKEAGQELNPLLFAPSHVLRVPVLVMSAAADVRECRVKPDFVEVTVRGERAALEKLQEKDVHAIVDLTDIESARGVRKRIEVTTPPGVVHVRVNPEDVEVVVPPKNPVPAASAAVAP